MARRFLTLWLALNSLAFIFAGQTWWTLQISTGDQNASLSGTGFDSDRTISAVLLFGLAAWLFVAFSRGWAPVVISGLSAVATVGLSIATVSHFLSQNIGGISTSVEKHTGITIDPVIAENSAGQISAQLEIWGWFTLLVLALLAVIQVWFAVRYRGWSKAAKPKGDRTKPKQDFDSGGDAISLWDNQR